MKTLIFIVSAFIFISGSSMNSKTSIDTSKNISQTERDLFKIADEYDSTFFKALFSLEEFRPFSIIQIDKISRLYNNNWIAPSYIYSVLNTDEKSILIEKIGELIDGYSNPLQKKAIVNKLICWCNADVQMNLISEKFNFGNDGVFNALHGLNSSKEVISLMNNQSRGISSNMTAIDKDQAYNYYLNYISGLSKHEQMKYYSELFEKLSELSVNN